MHLSLLLAWASSALARTYTLSIYSPGTIIDGAKLDAAGFAFYTGLKTPATYCPSASMGGASCPLVQGTVVNEGMSSMAVMVPGGQQIYVGADGLVKYTQAHSSLIPTGSFVGGWYGKTVVSDCAPTIQVLDFLSTDGSNLGGVMLCPDVPLSMGLTGASYALYTKTANFNATNCVGALGLMMHPSNATIGSWQYT